MAALTLPQTNDDGDVVLLSAVPTTGPATVETTELLATVRNDVLPGVEDEGGIKSYVGGYTASYVDLATLISQRLLLVIGVVIMLGFLLLMVAFRSLLIPLQAALTNVLSAAAAFGILTAVFQWGWGVSLVGIDTASSGVPNPSVNFAYTGASSSRAAARWPSSRSACAIAIAATSCCLRATARFQYKPSSTLITPAKPISCARLAASNVSSRIVVGMQV